MAGKKRSRPQSPLDSRQRSLQAEERKLQLEMERLERLIQEAPERQAEEERRRKFELVERARAGVRRPDSRVLQDKRYELHTGYGPRTRRTLKSERREARIKFFGLCVLLIALVIFLLTVNPF